VLDQWYQPKAEGLYKVECEFELDATERGIARASGQPYIPSPASVNTEIPVCKTVFKKLPYNEERIKAACKKYFSDTQTGTLREVIVGVDFLAFCPLSIGESFLLQVVEKGRTHVVLNALDYLIQKHAQESADSLLQWYNSDKLSEDVRDCVVSRLRLLERETKEKPKLSKVAKESLIKIQKASGSELMDPVAVEQEEPGNRESESPKSDVRNVAVWLVPGLVVAVVVLTGIMLFLLRRRK
jgi:hypothetical protein